MGVYSVLFNLLIGEIMKKVVFLFGLMSSVAFAADLTVVNPSNKSSPSTVLAQVFQEAVPNSEFYQSQTCEDAIKKLESTPNSAIVYNANVGIAATKKGLKCDFNTATKDNTVFIGESFYQLCTSAKSPKTFEGKRVTFGAASVALSPGLIDDYNKANNLNLVAVPYGGTKDVIAAIINGDVDIGMVGSAMADKSIKTGNITCMHSTDPTAENFIGKKYKLIIPGLRIKEMIYVNSSDPKVIETFRAATQSESFKKQAEAAGLKNIKTSKFADKDLTDFRVWMDFNLNAYWK